MLLCFRLLARCAFVQAFDLARALGMNVVRIWAYADGQTNNIVPLQPQPGIYNEVGFLGLDLAVAEAAQRGLRVLLTFTDYWHAHFSSCTLTHPRLEDHLPANQLLRAQELLWRLPDVCAVGAVLRSGQCLHSRRCVHLRNLQKVDERVHDARAFANQSFHWRDLCVGPSDLRVRGDE